MNQSHPQRKAKTPARARVGNRRSFAQQIQHHPPQGPVEDYFHFSPSPARRRGSRAIVVLALNEAATSAFSLQGSPFALDFAPILRSHAVEFGSFTGFAAASARLIEALATAASTTQRAYRLGRLQALLPAAASLVPHFFLSHSSAVGWELAGLHVADPKPRYAVTAAGRAALALTP